MLSREVESEKPKSLYEQLMDVAAQAGEELSGKLGALYEMMTDRGRKRFLGDMVGLICLAKERIGRDFPNREVRCVLTELNAKVEHGDGVVTSVYKRAATYTAAEPKDRILLVNKTFGKMCKKIPPEMFLED